MTAKTTLWNRHLRLDHCHSETINHVKKINEIKVTQKKASKTVQCDTCAVFKMHRLIQRKSSAKTTKFFQMLHFDLIINNKTFDKTTCITHFIYAAEWGGLVWVFTPGNQTEADLVSVWVSLGPVWTGSGFCRFGLSRLVSQKADY